MSEKKSRKLPWRGTAVPAAICALLLTVCLLGAGFGLLAVQVTTSRELHERGALAEEAVNAQMDRIERDIRKLAEEEGFDAEKLLSLIGRERVEQMDREIIAWWTGFAATGKLEQEPEFSLEEGRKILLEDETWIAKGNAMMAESRSIDVIRRAEKAVRKSGMQFRDLLLKAAERLAGDRVNLPRAAGLIRSLPGLCGAAALLLAGLIALVRSRRIQTAGQYIGGALSAAGLLSLLTLALIRGLGIRGMIAEASPQLEAQYARLAGTLTAEVLAGAAVLLILGGLCIALARKEYR